MSAPAWLRIPVFTAGVAVLMYWYLPGLAEALTTLQPLSVVAVVVLAAGGVFLGEIVPSLTD
jgi:hypothetical protein